jgi:hypothetical protein
VPITVHALPILDLFFRRIIPLMYLHGAELNLQKGPQLKKRNGGKWLKKVVQTPKLGTVRSVCVRVRLRMTEAPQAVPALRSSANIVVRWRPRLPSLSFFLYYLLAAKSQKVKDICVLRIKSECYTPSSEPYRIYFIAVYCKYGTAEYPKRHDINGIPKFHLHL